MPDHRPERRGGCHYTRSVSEPYAGKDELHAVLDYIVAEAYRYLDDLDDSPVRMPGADEASARLAGPLPDEGEGALPALRALVERGLDGAIRSSGPRFFHFVQGGVTPAAHGADWLTSTLDQNPGMWVASPLAEGLEVVVIEWLKDLFGIPQTWGGVLTTGAQMANFTGLAAGRRWWAAQHGVDVERDGLAGLPQMPVFASGLVHPTAIKAMGMLGVGRDQVRMPVEDGPGHLDVDQLGGMLEDLRGAPALLIATAGEPNAGDFDPIRKMADLAEQYGCWLHVDGAFGLFGALSDRSRHLLSGMERAHSIISDGHKWLNVPYDCGFAFVRERTLLSGTFGLGASYLSPVEDEHPNAAFLSPESSRRARALPIWATLRAYGRSGYAEMVGRHLDLAQRLATLVDEADDLERLADVALNIVCFRYRPSGLPAESLDEINARLAESIIHDGRVYLGGTVYDGKRALRPAIVNWRTTDRDIDEIVAVVRELGRRLV
jgi:glutamate/tyrosine decarboxylase-like PLP-dependent enzyme